MVMIAGHQFDRKVRDLERCKSALNEAYTAAANSSSEYVKKLINEALAEVVCELIEAEDEYNTKA
jgi:hypothetical protein